MIITEFDAPLTAEDARKISLSNREDSVERYRFREVMGGIKHAASFGHTRYVTMYTNRDMHPNEHVQNVLRSFGYKVVEKRAYKYDEEKKSWSDKPLLDHSGREQFFLEITWG